MRVINGAIGFLRNLILCGRNLSWGLHANLDCSSICTCLFLDRKGRSLDGRSGGMCGKCVILCRRRREEGVGQISPGVSMMGVLCGFMIDVLLLNVAVWIGCLFFVCLFVTGFMGFCMDNLIQLGRGSPVAVFFHD